MNIEIPWTNHANIGIASRWQAGDSSFEEGRSSYSGRNLFAGLGLFTRLQHSPAALPMLNVFAKFEGLVGPFIMLPSGIALHLEASAGLEWYVNPWFGFSLGVGQAYKMGRVTIEPKIGDKKDNASTMTTTASIVTLGIKSTYF